uniref:Uncharacterized protein n=1 Tax=Anguilla anguilla TaxID=7936 RepID=A0A0E9WJM5_ANGAN
MSGPLFILSMASNNENVVSLIASVCLDCLCCLCLSVSVLLGPFDHWLYLTVASVLVYLRMCFTPLAAHPVSLLLASLYYI